MAKRSLMGLYAAVLMGTGLFTSCGGPESVHPEYRDITDAVFASGYTIRENEYLVTANTEAFIYHSLVREGDRVDTSSLLFLLSGDVQMLQVQTAQDNYRDAGLRASDQSPQIRQLKIQIEQAKSTLEVDRKNNERYAELLKTNAVSHYEAEQARLKFEASQQNLALLEQSLADLNRSFQLNLQLAGNQLNIQRSMLDDYSIRSAISGEVLSIYKQQGELVRRGESIAKIGGGGTLVKLFIAEEDIALIRKGQAVTIALNSEKDKVYQGFVSKIYPSFDLQEQSFVIEAEFSEIPATLLAGTRLQANIIIGERKHALVIPAAYLNRNGTVTLQNGSDVKVKTGFRTGEWVEILEGIDEKSAIIHKENH